MSAVGSRYPDRGSEQTVGELVTRASQQISELARQEMLLARTEMMQKGKRYGVGGGLIGGAGLVGVLAAQALVVAGIAALSLFLPVWAAALIAAGVLAVVAAGLAAASKKQIARAGSPAPERTIDSIKADVAEIKEKAHR
ncbi:phage holin family protein [Streptomyces sp. NPDC001591]|uniref:phage holin family protein n=1 Tax=Streptomyces sp. NPDC001591 TaxID=3364589 RepID=UPI0036C7006E